MKNNIFYFLIMIFIFNSIKYAQNYELLQLNNYIKINNNFGDIGKGLQFEQAIPISFMPDDILVDNYGNFIICDKFSKKIIIFDNELNPLKEIQIIDENFGEKYVFVENTKYLLALNFNVDIEVDDRNNIYVLISKNGFFYKMLKYNNDGILDNSFKNFTQLEEIRAKSFYVYNEKIFILTSPGNFFDQKYVDDGTIFIFNTSGIFLGRGNYCYEDRNGNVYKQNNINKKNKLWIDQYSTRNLINKFFVSELDFIKNLYADLDDNIALRFLGIDNDEKLFFINKTTNGIIGKIFNFSDDTVTDITIKYDEFRNQINQYLIPHNPFVLSPLGEIFIVALSTGEQTSDWFKVQSYNNIAITFFKLINK